LSVKGGRALGEFEGGKFFWWEGWIKSPKKKTSHIEINECDQEFSQPGQRGAVRCPLKSAKRNVREKPDIRTTSRREAVFDKPGGEEPLNVRGRSRGSRESAGKNHFCGTGGCEGGGAPRARMRRKERIENPGRANRRKKNEDLLV